MKTIHQLTITLSIVGVLLSLYMGITYENVGHGLHPVLVAVICTFMIGAAIYAATQLKDC